MIYYIFDLDDTLIIHYGNKDLYSSIKPEKALENTLKHLNAYIFTNGTDSHAQLVLDKMNITHIKKIFARDTIPYMKPDIRSFLYVQKNILYQDNNYDDNNTFIFYDDLLENLQAAKKLNWITIWIHPKFNLKNNYNYVDAAFPNIYDALIKMLNL
jgi:FMN phosphatase YigB (HAD superfamily)